MRKIFYVSWRDKSVALFEDEPIDDLKMELSQDTNKYLDNPESGLELIKRTLFRNSEKNVCTKFDTIISEKIFPVLSELELENELEIYQTLIKISNQIKEQQKINLLEGKKILGVGGQFSAGKSCFINSITNAKLPVDQRPTTSIATYIVYAETQKNLAITLYNNVIGLDDYAMDAITHKFYKQYQLGFSKLIKNLVVQTPDFQYPNIAILDTPGYSKADMPKKEENQDKGMAREQLNAADYLIWLADSENGLLVEPDLEFISSLNVNSEILIVFTKASLKTEEDLEQIIQNTKNTLENRNMKIYGVIAYDSLSKETVIGKGILEQFLDMINNSMDDSSDITEQICNIKMLLENQLELQRSQLQDKIKSLEEILIQTSNIEHISAIVKEYSKCQSTMHLLNENGQILINDMMELQSITQEMKGVQ